jgi:hypothetical protein
MIGYLIPVGALFLRSRTSASHRESSAAQAVNDEMLAGNIVES